MGRLSNVPVLVHGAMNNRLVLASHAAAGPVSVPVRIVCDCGTAFVAGRLPLRDAVAQ